MTATKQGKVCFDGEINGDIPGSKEMSNVGEKGEGSADERLPRNVEGQPFILRRINAKLLTFNLKPFPQRRPHNDKVALSYAVTVCQTS